jgi:F-type H+-transporting ATPase subunit delta
VADLGHDVVEEAGPTLERAAADGVLARVAEELLAVSGILTAELPLRRVLADPSLPAEVKRGLLDGLLGDKANELTIDLVGQVSARRVRPVVLVDLVERLGAHALLMLAEAEGTLDDTEDELFRFSRLLVAEPRLRLALDDASLPLDRRVAVVDALLEGKVTPATLQLVRHVVRNPRGRPLERAVESLAELAAAARGTLLAEVRTALPLDPERHEELRATLGALKDRPVDLHLVEDPSIMGGVVVRIGDELIDGSLRRQFEQARRDLE